MVIRILFKSLKDSDYKKHFSNRLGIYKNTTQLKDIVWFHAVSLGEVISSQKIVKTIAEHENVVLTVTTPTGLREAKKIFGIDIEVVYAPWDFKWFVLNFFKTYKPKSLIIFETEIWPNMIFQAFNNKIPVILSNGRMSESSFNSYKKLNLLSKEVFTKITHAFVQSEAHKERFNLLGINEKRISSVGSVKFDVEINNSPLRHNFEEKIFLAASTHKKEDEIIINLYLKLLEDYEDLKLIIAPRHPERAESIQRLLTDFNLDSSLSKQIPKDFIKHSVHVIKATGLLRDLYSIATLAFVGGSLFKEYGGHNIIEPASNKSPFIVGPHMRNFKDILNLFLEKNACLKLNNPDELFDAFKKLLNNDKLRTHMIDNAYNIVDENKGSSNIQYNYLKDLIK